jgi:crotonobetainyl-CoA:carnitine CoA-transferase CaiB-like acyl-CoA transferase
VKNAGPLSGITVIELSTVVMGPWAAKVLADYGADVIKVEAPDGDIMRQTVPQKHAGMGAVFLNINRGKRSIVLDLKTANGRAALLKLCSKADVFVNNVRPEAMRRLGLGYDAVRAVNAKIIYVNLVGFSQAGPYAKRAAYDDLIQGACGLASLFERSGDDRPRYVPMLIVDHAVGISAVNAILAALLYRERTGIGQAIDVPMFETMAELVLSDHLGGATFEPEFGPMGYARTLTEYRRPYRTCDGYMCVLLYNEDHWVRFFTVAGEAERYARDPHLSDPAVRRENYGIAYRIVEDVIATRTSAHWLELLEKHDIPVMPMHTLETLLDDPHLTATGFFTEHTHPTEGRVRSTAIPTTWSASQLGTPGPVPTLGQHTAEILAELETY